MHSNDDINNADILDCMRNRQVKKNKQQSAAGQDACATSGFVALDSMVESKPWTASLSEQNSIVNMIRQDFCLSSEDDDELDLPNVSKSKFGNQILKTYSKERSRHATPNRLTDNDDQDDRMSCSSGLSVQEAEANESLLPKLNQMDAHSSQKMRQNLLNLSESLSTPISKTENKPQTTSDNCDSTKLKGTFESQNPLVTTASSQSMLCDDWSDSDSILAEYNTEPSDELAEKHEKTPSTVSDMLFGIPLSEWQTPMDLPGEQKDKPFEMDQTNNETVSFWTASKKVIPVSEETMNRASSLMAQATAEESNETKPPRKGLSRVLNQGKEENCSFWTASKKIIPVSEETMNRASSLMAQATAEESNETKPSRKGLSRVLNQGKEENCSFWTASKKVIPVSQETMNRASSLMVQATAEESNETKPSRKGLSRVLNQGKEENCSFWTASKKIIPVSEETMNRASSLMAQTSKAEENCEAKHSRKGLSRVVTPRENCRKIADKKFIPISEESMKRASSLMAQTAPAQKNVEKSNEAKPLQKGLSRINTSVYNSSKCESKPINSQKSLSKIFESCPDHKNVPISKTTNYKSPISFNTANMDISINNLNTESLKAIPDLCETNDIRKFKPPTKSQVSEDPKAIPISEAPKIPFTFESPKIEPSDFQKTLSACQQIIKVSDQTKEKAIQVMTDLQTMYLENQKSVNEPIFNDEGVRFHTACQELFGISDEAKNNVTRILTDLKAAISQCALFRTPALEEFQNACTNVINVMEESQNVASRIMRNYDEAQNMGSTEPQETKLFLENPINDCKLNEEAKSIESNVSISPGEHVSETESEISSGEDFNGFFELETPKIQKDPNADNINDPQLQATETFSKSQPEKGFATTPSCPHNIHSSLSQLANRSPLDKSTKSAIIARRNLLTLNRRKHRNLIRPEVELQPKKERPPSFSPKFCSTSTPLVDRNPNILDNSVVFEHRNSCDREDLTPQNKKRRCLGLSRMPNKF
ncbi:breast cancer type 2 susceptibility protein homolog [Drosophila willistoni]|uniref:breast cancer type 2 susceptibility protein homolog n=1 Tax=Drosophila willistoni TaxID=7260 RepID=UPI000C26CED7|nr:breast cancer type 2 susceptibility protein homolog [Drosophila willistoni]